MAKAADTLPVGTEVTWHYRSAIGHGTIEGIAEEADTSADTKYRIKEHDHHPGEPDTVEHYGRALTVKEKAEKAAGGNHLNLFAPFTKVEATPDGGRQVWGFATAEVVDSQGEIIDYDGTLKAFDSWSTQVEKDSRGLSLGNVREMHLPNAVGKVLEWNPGEKEVVPDEGESFKARGIYVGARVPPGQKETIEKLDEGILTGFSIGGRYAKRWYDEAAKAHRYIPELAELSLVDRPSVPVATFDVVKSQDGRLVMAAMLKADEPKEGEREKLHEEAEARAKKFGISFKDGGHLTPPKGYPTDEDKYGDPVNYRYPFDEPRERAAVTRFNDSANREKGGYSEEEWAKIGKRIAGGIGGHEFKDGKIEATEERKEAAKAALAAVVKKAADGDELSHGDIRSLICAALREKSGPFDDGVWVDEVYDEYVIAQDWEDGKTWRIPYEIKDGEAALGDPEEVRQTWEPVPVKGEKAVNAPVQKADKEDRAVDERLKELERAVEGIRTAQGADEKGEAAGKPRNKEVNDRIAAAEKALEELKAAQGKDDDEDEKDEAEKAAQALQLLKSATGSLEKRGVAISARRRKHLMHAVDHIHHAMGHDDDVEDEEHIRMTDEGTKQEPKPEKGEEKAAEEAAKAAVGAELRKVFGGDDLQKAVASAVGSLGLAKAEDVQKVTEDLAKAGETITSLEGRIKAIEDAPTPGPFLTTAAPGLGGEMPWGVASDTEALARLQASTDNPVLKDAIGRELATRLRKQQLAASGGARRPTA